jgi:hypothetical protein
MAKKTTKTNKQETIVEQSDSTEVIETIMTEASEKATTPEIEELEEKLEEIKPTEEFVNQVMENPETAQEVLETKIEELDILKAAVEEQINKVINENPNLKKKNSAFTYFWNGMNMYE